MRRSSLKGAPSIIATLLSPSTPPPSFPQLRSVFQWDGSNPQMEQKAALHQKKSTILISGREVFEIVPRASGENPEVKL